MCWPVSCRLVTPLSRALRMQCVQLRHSSRSLMSCLKKSLWPRLVNPTMISPVTLRKGRNLRILPKPRSTLIIEFCCSALFALRLLVRLDGMPEADSPQLPSAQAEQVFPDEPLESLRPLLQQHCCSLFRWACGGGNLCQSCTYHHGTGPVLGHRVSE